MQNNNINPIMLRLDDAANYLGMSITSLWRLDRDDPTFPKKIKLSSRVVGYRVADLDAYLQNKIDGDK